MIPDTRGGMGWGIKKVKSNQTVNACATRKGGLFSWSAGVNLALLAVLLPAAAASDCLPIGQASQHVGETKCIVGKVYRVKAGAKGTHFVDFCESQMACPFTVVVFARDLKDVGDVRRLAGRVIEIHGPVKLYDGRAEIILNRVSQLTGGSTLIPPLPKNYDVEKEGHYSAGRLRPTKKPAKVKGTVAPTAIYGNEADVSGEPPQ
jgi:hypothetical protein